jgi:hypothetical protein
MRQQSVVDQVKVGKATIESSRCPPIVAVDRQAEQSRRRRRSSANIVSHDAASGSLHRYRLLPSSANLRLESLARDFIVTRSIGQLRSVEMRFNTGHHIAFVIVCNSRTSTQPKVLSRDPVVARLFY